MIHKSEIWEMGLLASIPKLKSWKVYQAVFLTLPAAIAEGILGSTSPLNLDPLRYLGQRWFSPQTLTFGMPYRSCITAKFV
ncbi:MAG: hypothetical protein ICV54_14760 [Nostoc sp. C3-bin3]|nr:hypothetical protein [Nostoc sp. C3-bin3]